MSAQLDTGVFEHGYIRPVALVELRVRIDVYDPDLERKAGLQRTQIRDQIITEMTVETAEDGQRRFLQPAVGRQLPSTRNGM